MHRTRQWIRPARRPPLAVEQLERREVPSATTFIDAAGNRTLFFVNEDHHLIRTNQFGQNPVDLGGNVLNVHAFRDLRGALGLDIVFTNNDYFQLSSAGVVFLGHNVRAASTTFDFMGRAVVDVVFTNNDAFRISAAGPVFLGHDIRFVSNFRDVAGNVGLEIVNEDEQAFEFDVTGARFLGGDIDSVEHFNDVTIVPLGQVGTVRLIVADIVFSSSGDLFDVDGTASRLITHDADSD